MSDLDDLRSFVRSKAESPGEPEAEIDWETRKTNWIREIDALYSKIREWLQPLVEDGTVRILPLVPITIEEDYLGSYSVNSLALLIGRQRFAFYPKGTLVVGAQGRVDIRGPAAVRSLILDNGNWYVVERTPRVKTVPFDEPAFQDVLNDVLQ